MALPTHHRLATGSPSPPSPGLRSTRTTSPFGQSHDQGYTDNASSRWASLDLTAASQDTYDTWMELQEFRSSSTGRSDTQNLLKPRGSRSPSISSASSSSSNTPQSKVSQWLYGIGAGIAFCHKLPIIRHIVWLYQWLNGQFTGLISKSRFHGWRMGILLGIFTSSLILGCNIAILIFGGTRNGGYRNGFAVLMIGEAEDMSWWSSAFHIAINVLSTLLLAVSNYTMQVLSSPTRGEVDQAHSSNQWFDVGVLSMRNLRRISRRRLMICIIMGISSIPVHLFYNSAVSYIGTNTDYNVYLIQVGSDQYANIYEKSDAPNSISRGNSYKMIRNSDWAKTYDTSFVSYGDIYLAVDDYASELNNETLDGFVDNWPNVDARVVWELNETWTIGGGSVELIRDITATGARSKDWINFDSVVRSSSTRPPKFAHVTNVFVERIETSSRVQLSLTFMAIVVACNTMKLCTMVLVLFMEKSDHLVTLGDGAASFLEHPDPTTERMCVVSKQNIIHEISDEHHKSTDKDQLAALVEQANRTWAKQYSQYSTALNIDRDIGSYFIFILMGILFACLLATIFLFGKLSRRWGTSSDTTFLETDTSTQSTLLNAWLANSAQLILSFCYFTLNSECSAMAGASEWNSLATSRKSLRVTSPVGQQRETYFLQLPYRWSLPLTMASGFLHWLLSQSIFVVRIDTYDRDGKLVPARSQSACGFSGMSFMALTLAFYTLVGVIGIIGRKRFRVKIPFAASCSLVISAACHPTSDDSDPQLRPLQWGVVEERMYDGEKHCALSSKGVRKPKVGEMYL